MEEYLERCLNSLLIPSIDNIEILVVNDGSKDRSSEIAHQYADRYPLSIKVIDKENGNYGSCINAALPIATGKYVKILDADDYFDSLILENFVHQLKEIDVDLFITDCNVVNPDSKPLWKISFKLQKNTKVNFNDSYIFFKDTFQMHCCCYSRAIFKKFDYFQSEGISYTDTEWVFSPMNYVDTIYYYAYPLYYYVVGRNGQTMSPIAFAKNINHEFLGIEKMLKIFSQMETKLDYSHKDFLWARLFKRIRDQYYYTLFAYFPMISFSHLEKIDLLVCERYPYLHSYLAKIRHSKTGFKYINYWRKNKDKKCRLLIPLYCHHILIKLYNIFKNTNN